ncbi:MAG: site-specific DNA-methyltransferase [Patescibacteria group bacterium]|nr:site-specific DNA-methyltransferase [Patescibacteria group bacterium]
MKSIEELKNTIIQGDCLEVMKDIPDKSIDLVVTSPPYGDIRDYDGFVFNFNEIAKQLYRVVKEGGVVVWIVGDQTINGDESGESFRQALFFKEIGFRLHDTMIYDKGKVVFPDSNRYHPCFEYMFILSKNKPNTVNLIKDRKNKWGQSWGKKTFRQKNGERKQKDIIKLEEIGVRFNIWTIQSGYMHTTKDEYAFEHPAMFPEQLAGDHVKSWSNEGDIVLDPFNGSGTTTKMAHILNRNFIGIEISEKYCEIARQRLRQNTLL